MSVLPWLLVGDKALARDREALRAHRVTYILNVTPSVVEGGVANYFEKEAGIVYLRLPLRDLLTESVLLHMPAAVDFLQRARVRADGRVLVHCNEGRSRSASVVVGFLVQAYGKSVEDALEMVTLARPQARPKPNFVRQLESLAPAVLEAEIDGFGAADPAATNAAAGAAGKRAPSGPAAGPPQKRAAIGPAGPPGPPAERDAPPASGPAIGPAMPPGRSIGARPSDDTAIGASGRPAPRIDGAAPADAERAPPCASGPAIGPASGPASGPVSGPAIGPAPVGPRPAIGPATGPTMPPR